MSEERVILRTNGEFQSGFLARDPGAEGDAPPEAAKHLTDLTSHGMLLTQRR